MSCPDYHHSHICATRLGLSEIAELDGLVYVDPNKLADLHTEAERLEARIQELEGQLVPASNPLPWHCQGSRIIETQSRYIEDRERIMTDMRQSERLMERKIHGLEDQLDNIRTVDRERLRDRDTRIRQLEEELTASNRTISEVWTRLRGGELGDAVEDLRSCITMLVDEQDKEIRDLEAAVGFGIGSLEEPVCLIMENSIKEMRKTCAKEVQFVKRAVNKVEVLVQAAARVVDLEE